MKYNKTDKKFTYEMTSPGKAWNDYVNSKEGHNAAAVTPAYLVPQEKQKPTKMEQMVADRLKELEKQGKTINEVVSEKEKGISKQIDKGNGRNR